MSMSRKILRAKGRPPNSKAGHKHFFQLMNKGLRSDAAQATYMRCVGCGKQRSLDETARKARRDAEKAKLPVIDLQGTQWDSVEESLTPEQE